MSSAIPKLLHQTWKTEDIPPEWARYAASWRAMHPGWEYRLWTDEANRAFVAAHYPAFLPVYDGYSYGIQRADAVRYCLLHHFGGVYVDLDIECLQPIDALIEGQAFVGVLEPAVQGERFGKPSLLSNAFIASRPGHPLLNAVIAFMAAQARPALTHLDVLESTGPLMLDAVFRAYAGHDIEVLPTESVFPFPAGTPMLERLRAGSDTPLRAKLVAAGTYAAHYWANSWVGTLAGDLVNPPPYTVPGYDFYPGFDSPGHDIANVGRDIPKAAVACDAIEGALGFNTDGFVKGALLPRASWQPMGNGAPDEGLYVKRHRNLFSRLIRRDRSGR